MTVSPISENQTDLKSIEPTGTEQKHSVDLFSLSVLLVIFVLVAVAYGAVIQNIFHSDDYAHIRWACNAVGHPEMVLQAFTTSWVGCQSVPFYRPLTSFFIYVDYLIWGNNGFGFHLTNVVLHLATSVAVWALAREFGSAIVPFERGETEKGEGIDIRGRVWALAAAGLFAVYPLHPEAVSWMIGRVDLLATLFSMCAFWLYIRWCDSRAKLPFVFALVCFACSLCSKETGVILPAVLLSYSFLIGRGGFRSAIKQTIPFWAMLGGYLLVRLFVLKTMVGGYGNVTPGLSELHILLGVWLASAQVLLCPVNAELISANNFAVRSWLVCTIFCGMSALLRFIISSVSARFGIFLLAWMAIALLPVLKYFVLTPDLQGGRMAYMCCIPLCLILTHGVAYLFDRSRLQVVAYTVAGMYICAGAFLTMRNNESWKAAGETMRAVHQALNSQYKSFPPDKILYFAGVPDQIHGAYAAVNAMEALFQRPQMQQDLHMCNNLSPADLFEPYGYIRNTLLTTDACRLYTWDSAQEKFRILQLDHAPLTGLSKSWRGEQLAKMLVTTPPSSQPTRRVEINFSGQGLNCWDAEFLQLKMQVIRRDNGRADSKLKMRFKNRLQPDYDEHSAMRLIVQPGEAIQTVNLPMHSNILWSLGGECQGLCFDYPGDWNLALLEITPKSSTHFLPAIEIRPKTPGTSLGIVWSNQVGSKFEIVYDVSQIENAASAELEITKPNVFFLHQNADGPVVEAGRVIASDATKGKIAIETKDMSNGLLCEMRIRALDSHGRPVGFASDHIVFINSP